VTTQAERTKQEKLERWYQVFSLIATDEQLARGSNLFTRQLFVIAQNKTQQ
jgi:hypothetical protein